jgi:hypothetical protein
VPDHEVPEPILNSPYAEPAKHWNIEEGESPEKRPGRRSAGYFYRDPKAPPSDDEHAARGVWQELTDFPSSFRRRRTDGSPQAQESRAPLRAPFRG